MSILAACNVLSFRAGLISHKKDRVYTEKGNKLSLNSVDYFTFEPHISIPGSKYGYKKENIYYFRNGKLTV